MKLDEFDVHEVGADLVLKGDAVDSVFPGVGSDAPGFANPARGDNDGLGFEDDEAAGLAPIGEGTRHAAAIGEKACDGAIHVHVDALLDAAVLKSANHLEAGAVTNVAEAFEGMAAESALQNIAIFGAVEES